MKKNCGNCVHWDSLSEVCDQLGHGESKLDVLGYDWDICTKKDFYCSEWEEIISSIVVPFCALPENME